MRYADPMRYAEQLDSRDGMSRQLFIAGQLLDHAADLGR
jgi:hypothetical protein